MANGVVGLRTVDVLEDVTEGEFSGMKPLLVEVSNFGSVGIKFYVNDFSYQGHEPSKGIPVEAGTTRVIPMQVYNFTASGVVTVVAYGG